MALHKPYLDVPGTTIFDAEQSRKGYHLNQFCMSLMKAANRERFKARRPAGSNRAIDELRSSSAFSTSTPPGLRCSTIRDFAAR